MVEEKVALMEKLGKKQLILTLQRPLDAVPEALADYAIDLTDAGNKLVFTFHAEHERAKIAPLLRELAERAIDFKDLQTRESSLEEIFVSLVSARS